VKRRGTPRKFRLTELLRALYVHGGTDTRYKIALNVIKALQREGIRAPSVTNVVKKIKILQDEGFYETVGTRDDLPVVSPSWKFDAYMAAQALKRQNKKFKEDSARVNEGMKQMISRLEMLIYS